VAGGVLLGGGILFGLIAAHRREQLKIASAASAAVRDGGAIEIGTPFLGSGIQGWVLRIVVFAGAPLLGALTALCWSFAANAWLDRSIAREVPARIESMTTTTHAFLYRDYELEYRLDAETKSSKRSSTPAALSGLLAGRDAVALVRDGRFGWRWVEDVVPASAPLDASSASIDRH
jgi:hypothetical protein